MSTSHIGARKFSLADSDPSLKSPSVAEMQIHNLDHGRWHILITSGQQPC